MCSLGVEHSFFIFSPGVLGIVRKEKMLLSLHEQNGFSPQKVTAIEYQSPCPACGGKDRFRIWTDKNHYWCRGCGQKGDAIQYLRDFKKLSFKDAAEVVGKDISNHIPKSTVYIPPAWQPKVYVKPETKWMEKAQSLVAWAKEQLWKSPDALEWLKNERGLTEKTIHDHDLGYIPQDVYRDKVSWGLGEDGKKLWIPAGVVIPSQENGTIFKIRVRRFDVDENRYVIVAGSKMPPVIYNPSKDTLVIVESDLCGLLLSQEVPTVTAMALGSDSIRPDVNAAKIIQDTPYVFNALDSDNAGAKQAWQWWNKHFPKVKRLPVIKGKDPTEAFKNGLDLKEWVQVGLSFFDDYKAPEIPLEDIPCPPLKPPTSNQNDVQDQYPLVDEKLSKALYKFFGQCIDEGSGLFLCESPEQAEQARKVIEPLSWSDNLRVTIIREKELNIYSSSSSKPPQAENKAAIRKEINLHKFEEFSEGVHTRYQESMENFFDRIMPDRRNHVSN